MIIAWRETIKKVFTNQPVLWKLLQRAKKWPYIYFYLRHYTLKWRPSAGSIRELNIEFCSDCNLRCSFCALDHLKPKKYITLVIVQKILMALTHDPLFAKVEVLNLYNGGETLLHPKRVILFEAIAEAKFQAKRDGRHFPKVLLLTNGMLLREKLAKELLTMKVFDVVQFSLDGGSKERFEALRVNAKWGKFYTNVTGFIALKQALQPSLKLKSITILEKSQPLTIEGMEPEFKSLLEGMDHYELRRLHDWGGAVTIGERSKSERIIGCSMAMHQLVVLPTGDVTVCCNDFNSKGVIGNIMNQSLGAVYISAERRHYLKQLLKGRRKTLPLCIDCTIR